MDQHDLMQKYSRASNQRSSAASYKDIIMEEDEKSTGRLSQTNPRNKRNQPKIGVPDSISQNKFDDVDINDPSQSAGRLSKVSRHSRTYTMNQSPSKATMEDREELDVMEMSPSKFGSGKTRDSGNKKMGFRASNALASI